MSFYHLNPNRRGERLARRLEQLGDYRVLRRLPQPEEIWCRSMPIPNNVMKLGIVDCETTGLDPERHKIIELAIGTLSIDLDAGDVVDVTPPQSWLEDPAEDLSIEIERLTHITSDMLIGKWIPDAEVVKIASRGPGDGGAQRALRPRFAIRRFPQLASLPGACSMAEVDWPALGWSGGRSIAGLLTQAGFFLPDAHRAAADVWATTCLLTSAAGDGRSVAAHLVDTARRVTHRLYANRAPFEHKDVLKAAGYRWSPERRAWWIEGDSERINNEATWLRQLSGTIHPQTEQVTWVNRHQ
ncbi:exonuclease domain-containing protein [uncultured Sphingomonas sp.]|uniref:exonuclease domain-containing protein n=1 Tax=uncultured Sphingomonas sp. TaxID=158754 RepID=UPI0035CBD638